MYSAQIRSSRTFLQKQIPSSRLDWPFVSKSTLFSPMYSAKPEFPRPSSQKKIPSRNEITKQILYDSIFIKKNLIRSLEFRRQIPKSPTIDSSC